MDFYSIVENIKKRDYVEVYPEFKTYTSKDIMTRGRDFYAIYNPTTCKWSRNESDVGLMIDDDLRQYKSKMVNGAIAKILYMNNYNNGMWTKYKKWLKESIDNYKPLDQKVIFSNQEIKKTDYSSRQLSYPLQEGSIENYEKLINKLYSPEERRKIEWAIGSIIAGDSKKIQKFFVFYGDPGTGKSTIMDIIKMLFDGYYTVFDAKSLGSNSDSFAMDFFENDPLLAIQEDGDLSRIEDNSRLNSIISHEEVRVNAKFKSPYTARANCMLFMGTNHPVQITDIRSGMTRRLIVIEPTGNRWAVEEYFDLMDKISFELSGIAKHCLDVYQSMGRHAYADYKSFDMLARTNPFYNFVVDNYEEFKNGISLKRAYEIYTNYADEYNYKTKITKFKFRDELRNYFKSYKETYREGDERYRNWFSDIDSSKLGIVDLNSSSNASSNSGDNDDASGSSSTTWLNFTDEGESIFDHIASNYPAQKANDEGYPSRKWEYNKTTLKQINTKNLHFVKVPLNHIVVDFDLKDANGNKDPEANIKAANKFPKTYAEFSKSGGGIHLHYIYDGDVTKLSNIYSRDVEVKVFSGNASLRRKLSKFVNLPIATISTGLPLKEERKIMVDETKIENEKHLRSLIQKGLNKEVFPNTAPSVNFICHVLDEAYTSGISYDVSDIKSRVIAFAANSTHQASKCIKDVDNAKFKSKDKIDHEDVVEAKLDVTKDKSLQYNDDDSDIYFFDVEVFPNFFGLAYKKRGKDNPVHKLFNPNPETLVELFKNKMVGFNNRKYDNHICYAAMLGYNNAQLFDLSNRIINKKDKNAMFANAYNLSYTDILDYMAASEKMSLKKWEIKLHIHHQELEFPWDKPIDEKNWGLVMDYCSNDVIATEATFEATSGSWAARKGLAAISGGTVNMSTNALTTKLIFGNEPNPHSHLVYTDLREMFPGYKFDHGVSTYRGYTVGEGGWVWAKPGIYSNVKVFDVASMHPHSMIALNIFGDKYTKRLKDLVDARIFIKHKDYAKLEHVFDGKLVHFVKDDEMASNISKALKTAINSIYGLTSAGFDNPFRDVRNIDNIVAKRGALFMINLKEEVEAKGYTVIHIKTDSIKVADPDEYITNFINEYGNKYGYTFEVEDEFERICLVNNAVYIGKYLKPAKDKKTGKDIWWHATGLQFQIPYVFKTLFSREPITLEDIGETKQVKTEMYLNVSGKQDPKASDMQYIGKVGKFYPVNGHVQGYELLKDTGEIYTKRIAEYIEKATAAGYSEDNLPDVLEYVKPDGKKAKTTKPTQYTAVTGTKGYLWMESEVFDMKGYTIDDVDMNYYISMLDDAKDTISKFGDFDNFVNNGEIINPDTTDIFHENFNSLRD